MGHRGQSPVAGWIGRTSWIYDASATAAEVLLAPIAAVVFFAAGPTRNAWIAVAVFGGGVVYSVLLGYELIDRSWARWKDEPVD